MDVPLGPGVTGRLDYFIAPVQGLHPNPSQQRSEDSLRFLLRLSFTTLISALLCMLFTGLFMVYFANITSRQKGNLYFLLVLPLTGLIMQCVEWMAYVWRSGTDNLECLWWSTFWLGRPLVSLPVCIFSTRLVILFYGSVRLTGQGPRRLQSVQLRQSRYSTQWMLTCTALGLVPFVGTLVPLCVLGESKLLEIDAAHIAFQCAIIIILIFNQILLMRRKKRYTQHMVTVAMMRGLNGITVMLIFGILMDNIGWIFFTEQADFLTGGLLVFVNYAIQTFLVYYFWYQTYRVFLQRQRADIPSMNPSLGDGRATMPMPMSMPLKSGKPKFAPNAPPCAARSVGSSTEYDLARRVEIDVKNSESGHDLQLSGDSGPGVAAPHAAQSGTHAKALGAPSPAIAIR